MVFKGLIAATAAVALAAAPAVAARNSALTPASETVRGAQQDDDGEGNAGTYVIAAVAVGVAVLGLVIAVGGGDDAPSSPN